MIAKANTSYSRHSSRYLFPLMSRLQQHCPSAQCSVLAGPLQQPPHTSPTFSPLLPPILRLQTSLFAASFRLCLVRLLASIPTAPTLHPSSRLLTYRVHSSNIALSKIENQATPQTIQEAEPAAQTRQTADTVSQTPPPPPRGGRAGGSLQTVPPSSRPFSPHHGAAAAAKVPSATAVVEDADAGTTTTTERKASPAPLCE